MALKDLFGWMKKQVKAPFMALFSQTIHELLGSNKSRQYLEEYRGWVFASVQARAEEVGNIQLKLFKGDEVQDRSEVTDLLNRVNPNTTKEDLFAGTQSFLDLEGNAFWFLARDNEGKGDIAEIWLLRPDKVSIITSKENPLLVAGYLYMQQDGKKIPFDPNEILHFRNFNPLGDHPFPHRGKGIVEAASWAIDTDNETRQWNFSFFKNSARPDGFLIREGTGSMSDEEYKRLKEQFNQEHQGSVNAHRVAILSGGLKWQDITRTQQDMDFIEQRRFGRDEILSMFRVPKSVIGIVEDVNRANAEASNFIFASRTIKPLMEHIVGTLNEFLIPEFGDDLVLDFESPVPQDRQLKINEYTAGIDKWLSRNEIRKAEGLPPSDNGNTIFGSIANVPIDNVPEEKALPKPSSKNSKRQKKAKEKKEEKKFVTKMPKGDQPSRLIPKAAIENYKEMWMKAFEVEEGPLSDQLRKLFDDLLEEVLDNIREELKGLEAKEYVFKAPSDFLFNKTNAISATISIMTPNIRRYIEQAAEQANLLTGTTTFDVDSELAQAFIAERADFFAKTFNDTTTDRLLSEIRDGLDADETVEELSARVSTFFDTQEQARFTTIARTEVAAASNFGAQESYRQAGVTQMQWLVVSPDDVDCIANEGAVVDIGDAFPSGDTAPPVHPNCVCTLLPFFE